MQNQFEQEKTKGRRVVDVRHLYGSFNLADNTYTLPYEEYSKLEDIKEVVKLMRLSLNRMKCHRDLFGSRGLLFYQILENMKNAYLDKLETARTDLRALKMEVETFLNAQKMPEELAKVEGETCILSILGTNKEFKHTYETLMMNYEVINSSISDMNDQINKIYQSIFNEEKVKRITESLEFYFKKYFSVVSHMQRSIATKEEIWKYNSISQGLIVIDFQIGCLMRKFREAIKHEKVKQMVEIGTNFQEILQALMEKFMKTLKMTEEKYKEIIGDEINFGKNSKVLETVS